MPHVVSLAKQEWNVSDLGTVHTLDLTNCDKVTDISSLHSVNTLILNNCTGIKDISMLYSVYSLTINNLSIVADVGGLRNLKILHVNAKSNGIHFLKELQELHFNFPRSYKINVSKHFELNKLKKINKKIQTFMTKI